MASQNINPNQRAARRFSSWLAEANACSGSWICLISFTEVRYDGIVYGFNPQDNSIALLDVCCFGTEERRRDGPQIPLIDEVYECMIFRCKDIRGFMVVSSTAAHRLEFYSDKDVQSEYPCPLVTSTGLRSTVRGSLTGLNSRATQPGLWWSNFEGPMPLHQPGENIGSLDAWSAAPNSAGGGGDPYGLPELHQPSLHLPPPDLVVLSAVQQPMQYDNFSPSSTAHPPDLAVLSSMQHPMQD